MNNDFSVLLSSSSSAPFGQCSQLHFELQGAIQPGLSDKQKQSHHDQLSSPATISTIWKAKCIKIRAYFLGKCSFRGWSHYCFQEGSFWTLTWSPAALPEPPFHLFPFHTPTPLLLHVITNLTQTLYQLLERTWKAPACSRRRRQRSKAFD